MTAPTVRRATPDEWREYRAVRLSALADAPYAFTTTTAEALTVTEEGWRQRLRDGACYLASVDGRDIGLVAAFPEDGGAELVSMWVHSSARGSGAADQLVEAIIAWAATEGLPEVRLWVARDNRHAELLYARHGFVRTGEVQPMAPETPDRLEFRMVRGGAQAGWAMT